MMHTILKIQKILLVDDFAWFSPRQALKKYKFCDIVNDATCMSHGVLTSALLRGSK